MKKNKAEKQLSRWLKALEIAKTFFEEEWYHTRYLEEIENFIKKRRLKMYSPKIKEDYIPKLFRQAKICKIPMTRLVNQIISEHLQKLEQAEIRNVAKQITQDILSKKRGDRNEQSINSRASM